jgi:putative transposase
LRRTNEILKASGEFLRGGARPPTKELVAFIDANRDELGVEPICKVLQVAPSTYYAVKARAPSARVERDAAMTPIVRQLWEDNYRAYGARKVWKAARRAGQDIGPCRSRAGGSRYLGG